MPESSVKYYPVIARILLLLGGLPLVTFRASVVSVTPDELSSYRMVHRFIMEYKGPSDSCAEEEVNMRLYRDKAARYLQGKIYRAKRYKNQILEPTVEIEINLRGVTARVQPM
ncbi:MAG: hypothetical protein WC050_01065 [Candidatus Paceibacterota bacterium]